jgi:hypothetical protein
MYAAALFVLFGWGWVLPPQTLAQQPDTTPPTTLITSPSDGVTVSGTITVTADAADNVGVARVYLHLDGTVVAVKETAPYSFAWDTTTLFDGSHTLTTEAWDTAGNSTRSSPVRVTVSNGGVEGVVWTSPVNVTAMGSSLKKTSGFPEVEDAGAVSSQTIPSSGGFVRFIALGGRTLTVGLSPDNPGTSSAEIDFGLKLWETGNADVVENGRVVWMRELFGSGSVFRIAVESGVVNYSQNGRVFYTSTVAPTFPLRVDTSIQNLGGTVADVVISNGTAPAPDTTSPAATITFPLSGSTVSGRVVVAADAWDNVSVAGVQLFVDGAAIEVEDTQRPYGVSWDTTTVADGSHTLTAVARDAAGNIATSAPVTVTVSNATPSTVTRFEETDPSIVYTAGWNPGDTSSPWSGGTATYTASIGARATFTFTGTAVSWLGYRGPFGGIARVFLDGTLVTEVDVYAAMEEVPAVVFTTSGLVAGSHTLMIELTGMKNPSAFSNVTAVDAFEVTSSSSSPAAATSMRLEETDPHVTYSAGWIQGNTDRTWSGGTAAVSTTAGAQAMLSFTGRSVRWIGFRGPQTGIARVSLDGVFLAEVDTFSTTEEVQAVFIAADLPNASHTLTIEVTGTKNAASTDAFIVVDAFDVSN